jgi:hypothetical protein
MVFESRAHDGDPTNGDAGREAMVQAHPRTPRFKEDVVQAFWDIRHKRRAPSAT